MQKIAEEQKIKQFKVRTWLLNRAAVSWKRNQTEEYSADLHHPAAGNKKKNGIKSCIKKKYLNLS